MMSLAKEENPDKVLYINFNQDAKMICLGHKDGYMFYKTSDILESSHLQYEGENSSNPYLNSCIIVERLFSSALMILVSQHDPRVMHVYHFTSKNIICDNRFNRTILNVKLNRERIVVCLEDCIFIYHLKEMRMLHSIMDTPTNELGICDLTPNSGAILAYPGSVDTGSVHIFDAINLTSVNTFVAHEGSLAALKFNPEGNMLATASTKGTVIRVYSVPHGSRLFEFRRGVSRFVTIYSLAFSPDSAFLASSSNTETVHVFKLEKPKEAEKKTESSPDTSNSGGGWFDVINRTVAAYIPTQVSDLITHERSFAQTRLPGVTKRNVVSMITHKNQNHVVVATSDGFVYCYQLDANTGEMDLLKQYKIGPAGEGTCRRPISPGSSSDPSNSNRSRNNSMTVPNMDDPEDFPPMSHNSG